MLDHLAKALEAAIAAALNQVSDKILRIAVPRDWPLDKAVEELADVRELRVFVRPPFAKDMFPSDVEMTEDAGVATAWRNSTPRSFAILVLGRLTGNLDAGLNDIRDLAKGDVVARWKLQALEELSKSEELQKPAVEVVLTWSFEEVADGSLSASALEGFLVALGKKPELDTIHKGLWRLGLLPDERLFDKGATKSRLQANKQRVEAILSPDDIILEEKLRKIASGSGDDAATAGVLLSVRQTSDRTGLKDTTLERVEAIFKTQAPKPGPRALDLTDVLNEAAVARGEVVEALQRMAMDWDLSAPEATFSASLSKGVFKASWIPCLREEENGAVLDTSWTGDGEAEAVLAARSSSALPEELNDSHIRLTESKFKKDLASLKCLSDFMASRAAMRPFEPWLSQHAFALFLLNESARTAAGSYLDAWEALVDEVSKADDRAALVEVMQALDTIQGSPTDSNEGVDWIVLGPLHPFRLDPILRVATEIGESLGEESGTDLGDAAQWALDRSVPAYPMLHYKEVAFARSSSKNLICYSRVAREFLPDLRDGRGIDRIFDAILAFSPWLKSSMSVLVVDPPPGGGLVKVLTSLNAKVSGRLVVYHLATTENCDQLDGFSGDLKRLDRVSALSEAANLPPVNAILRFAVEQTAAAPLAGANWGATKGAHLALELAEVNEGGAFASKKTPRIKLDAAAGNRVVKAIQQLYHAISGATPKLASIRPLLHTDDASALAKLAGTADWVVFGAPGPLGLVSPENVNTTLHFVGRTSSGIYGVYAYGADELFPIRRRFEEYFKDTPIASLNAPDVVEALVERAHQSGQAVLFAGKKQAPHLALLVAIKVATSGLGKEEQTFVLSLDDMGWTHAWVEQGKRADLLIVTIGKSGVRFIVVESKSKEGGAKIPLSPTVAPFDEAISQVNTTLRSLKEICDDQHGLISDLRYSSLIEHVMAAVLGRMEAMGSEQRADVIKQVNLLSRRETVPAFGGLVVLTQAGINSPTEIKTAGELQLVWAGSSEVENLFGAHPRAVKTNEDEPLPPVTTSHSKAEAKDEAIVKLEPSDSSAEADSAEEPQEAIPDSISSDEDETNLRVAREFIAAARTHQIPVEEDEPVYIETGPTLFAFGVRLRVGSSITPLANRLQDIARDIGRGDRTHEVEVSNDSRPRTVRVLMPREQRVFPALPAHEKLLSEDTRGYLPIFIGQTVNGQDWAASVESWPHLLVAGTTGSGKTTFMRSLLQQFRLYGAGAMRLVIVDGKGDTDYLNILPPDMFVEEFPDVQLGSANAVSVLRWAEEEMERRRLRIIELASAQSGGAPVKITDLYQSALAAGTKPEIVPLVLVIDEFADIMLSSKKDADEFERLVQRISQVGRSRMMHLILATQRPDKETVRGAIKANLNARAVFRLPTAADSQTVLGHGGAERLLVHGDMLFQHGTGVPIRLQGYSP